jgi:hypothetical protein
MGGKPRVALGLSDAWRHWVIEALDSGASALEIAEELAREGVPAKTAEREIDLIAWMRADRSSPLREGRAELALRLMEDASRRRPITRRPPCEREEFYERYLATSTPVVFEGGCECLSVVGKWTPDYLAERGGESLVKVSLGRDASPDHFVDPENFFTELPVREVVRRVVDAGRTNDIYMVSRNRASEGALACLADDFVAMPPFLNPDPRRGGWSLWFGPAGTKTPLHHDTSQILFCQIFGRKRIYLAAPCERELLFGDIHSTFYPSSDVSKMDVDIRVVDVGPGDSLFIPVGWWHGVSALDVSISLSLTGFEPPVNYDWYRPGMIR